MISCIIVAAGKGTRMGPTVDKLFLEVAGRPLIAHTWARFDSIASFGEIVLVIREGMEAHFHDLAEIHRFLKPYRLVKGGKERQDSVFSGLNAIDPAAEIVAIHDGARPCASAELVEETIRAAQEVGAAVAAQRVTDTIKESEGGGLISRHLDRSRLWAVQTPQTFRVATIRKALEEVNRLGLFVTDDTAACELIGQPVKLVESRAPNPKATSPADMAYLEILLKKAPGV